MNNRKLKKLAIFMAKLYADSEAWIPEKEEEKTIDGFTFVPKPHVKGVIVFGGKYPLDSLDTSIDNHLAVHDQISDAMSKSHGAIFKYIAGGPPVYHYNISGEIRVMPEIDEQES